MASSSMHRTIAPSRLLNPAQAGEIVIVYATGIGLAEPAVTSGVPAPLSPIASVINLPTVTIGGRTAEMYLAGLVPGHAGLYQLNVLVPAETVEGDQDLVAAFPSYLMCCAPGALSFQFVTPVSAPVRIPVARASSLRSREADRVWR
jgi:uncharacterized protein (TIGR03437 family)